MKKGNPNQKTLFQSWGKKKNPTLMPEEVNNLNNQNHSNNPIEIIDLGDDDEDDGLLAAALEMESIDPQTNQDNVIGNSSYAGNFSVLNSETSREEPKEAEYLPGFDMENGNVWIYPTNYPIRDYQYQIVEQSLFMNTLVTLPTGLGKTFIAAVLMYNYYRWYPQGKVIFMAPTKPLVAQQIEACYNIMGIPESDTAQMTGNMAPNKREVMWKDKRVFFLTPQVLQNDLSRGTCCPDDVVLLVFDEAHKALGNHAYCQVVREIYNYTRNFRVLALSATPGDDIKAVQQVMTNLLISHMELRSEDSPDIQPYTHTRTVDKIVIPLGENIGRIKTMFLKVLEGIVGRLFCNRALWQKDPQRITKYMLLSGRDQFRKRNLEGYTNGQKGAIEGDFAMSISLYHAYELLHQHGILSFYNFIKAIIDGTKGMARAKTEIMRNSQFMEIMEELRDSIECPTDETAETSALFSQFSSPRRRAMPKQPFDTSFKSHPKLLKLEEVIIKHFQDFPSEAASSTSVDTESVAENKSVPVVNTRVMIFSQYRDSVGEITAILNRHKPLVRVMSFIGQASTGKTSRGLSQKEQLEVIKRFRKGGYNTLVATCVGEEGLDIGDVDLIVCFDAHASPIRLVQRMGRTGRKRNGRIVVLVSEGKEEQVYKRSLSNKKSIHKAIVQGTKSFELYNDNPRMIPRHLTPCVLKMQMTVGEFVGNSKKMRKSETSEGKSNSITSFLGKPGTSKLPNVPRKDDGFLAYDELIYWQENFKLPNCEAGTTPQNSKRRRSRKSSTDAATKELSLNEWMAWQNVPSPVYRISHSRRTEHLIEILEFIELHGDTGEGEDDAYDVEMMSFLNEEDLIGPEDDNAMIVVDDDDDDDKSRNLKSKTEKKKKKEKRISNENGNHDDGDKNKSNVKQPKSRKKTKKSKSISPQQKTKWKEYLKGFENEDDDFDTGETTDSVKEKTENQKTNLKNEIPQELMDIEAGDGDGKRDVKRSGKENVKEMEEALPEKDATIMEEDDAFEISSQNLSQLLPSLTPQKVHVLRSRKADFTHDHAKDVPLPPSLDSLNQISPFTPNMNSGNKKRTLKLHQDKVSSCKRNISVTNFTEMEAPNFDFNRRIVGNIDNQSKGRSFSLQSKARENVIQEPPDLDLGCEFAEEIDINLEMVNNESKKFQNNSWKPTLRKMDFIDEPPELDLENEFEEFTDNEDVLFGNEKPSRLDNNLKVLCHTDSSLNDSLLFGALENNIQGKIRPESSKTEKAKFGAGVVCKSNTSDVFDDMEIVFGDDETLDDGLLADLDHGVVEGNDVDMYPIVQNERNNNTDKENKLDGKHRNSNSENNSEKSKLKLNSCGNSLKKTILKLGAFERNKNDSSKKPLDSVIKVDQIIDHTTHKDTNVAKRLETKTFGNSTTAKTVPGEKPQRQEEFTFKIPDTIPENRSAKTNHNTHSPKGCWDAKHESAQTGSPLFRSSPSKKSLKLNSRTNLMRQENKTNRELSLCGDDEKSLNRNTVFDLQENQQPRYLSFDKLHMSPCQSGSARRTEDDDSHILNKPLRERLACRGLADRGSNTLIPKDDQKDLEIFSNDEDSPVVKKKSRSKILPNIAAVSPLQECRNFANTFSGLLDEDSPDVRKKSKSKTLPNIAAVSPLQECRNFSNTFTGLLDEDSPVVRKKSKSKTLPNIAAVSPLQESQNVSNTSSEVLDGESPVVRRHSKAKIRNGNVFAIAESDEEFENDFEESDLQLLENEAFDKSKSYCHSDARRNGDVTKLKECRGRKTIGVSDSEDEFLMASERDRVPSVGGRHTAQRKIVLHNSVKRKRLGSHPPSKKQKRLHTNHYLEEEAELSGSDIDDFTDEESDLGDEFDSFIDDATQLTQKTPTCRASRDPRSPMDMGVLYRQSLMSPHARNLNFVTPDFHRGRNKYKMKFKPKRNGSESEAEETYARESDLENELGLDSEEEYIDEEEYEDESLYGDENESLNHNNSDLAQELSPFTPNQVQRPLKRVKRKHILNDSVEENMIVCKETPVKANLKTDESCVVLQSTQPFKNEKLKTLSHKSPQSSSSAMSSLITKENTCVAKTSPARLDPVRKTETSTWNLKNNGVISSSKTPCSSRKDGRKTRESSCMSNSFDFDWDNNGFSDFDLLDAVEKNDKDGGLSKPCTTRNTFTLSTSKKQKAIIQEQEMQAIAFAMSATDDDVNLDMSEMPTFSLGLDLFGDDAEENDQHSMSLTNQAHNKSTFPLTKTANAWKNAPFANTNSMKQPPPQKNGKPESRFTKIVSPHKSRESDNRVVSFKSSRPSTVQPFNKGPQNMTSTSQAIIKNTPDSFIMYSGNGNNSQTHGCVSGGSRLVDNRGVSGENGKDVPAATSTFSTGNIKQETNSCWNANDRGRSIISTPPNNTPKNIPRAFVSPSQRDKDKLVILVDTKEICNAQVVSCLRRKHNIKAEVCQLIHCDYVVSNRVGVARKLLSAVANGANAAKLLDKMRLMCDLYDRPCLIIERDRVKPGENERDLSKTHAYSHTLACIAQTHIKVLFSESQEESASLLTELATMESKKKSAIQAPLSLNKETQQVFRFLLSIPRVSYITALNLCSSLRTLRDLVSSSPDDLQKITKQLSLSRATEICNYLRHHFDETMTAKKKSSEC